MTTYHIPTSTQLTTIRNSFNQRTELFGTFLKPETLWQANVFGTPTRGDLTINFTNGTGSNFSAIKADMPVYVGSTSGSKDVGVLRVRNISSGDGGVTGTITVARNNLELNAGDFLTFVNDHPLFSKYPLILGDPENADFRKDGDIPYSNQNENLLPIVVAGSHKAGFIDENLGYWEVPIDLTDSYSLTPSATIVDYGLGVVPNNGVSTSLINGVGYLRFSQPGQFWVKYIVQDSNGLESESWRFYRAHSTDVTSPDYPNTAFDISLSGDWDRGGWTATLTFYEKADLFNLPEETLAIVWQKTFYDDVEEEITLLPNSVNPLFVGYLKKETITTNLQTGVQNVQIDLETVEKLLDERFMFSVSLEAKNTSPTTWYEFRNELTNGRGVYHLWQNHSNIFQICDVIGLKDDENLLRPYFEVEEGTLYSMANDIISNAGNRTHVISDKAGRLHITPDLQLLTEAEINALPTVFKILETDMSETFQIIKNPIEKAILATVSGVAWDGTFSTTETELCPNPPCPNFEAICASAPTTVPSDTGSTIVSLDQQTLRDQQHANELAGRLFAKTNNPYPEVRISFQGNYLSLLEPAYKLCWLIDINSNQTIREISWSNKKLFLKNVTGTIQTGTGIIETEAVFEPEIKGKNGVATNCLSEIPDYEINEPTLGDDVGGDVLVTGSSCHVKLGNWVNRSNDDVNDLKIDPFWVSKSGSFDERNAIILRCGTGYILRSTNLGVTWDDVTPTVDPPNNAGDSPAPTVSTVDYINVAANEIFVDEFIYIVRWQNTSGQWRSWLLYTNDDHNTYTWKSLNNGTTSSTYIGTMGNYVAGFGDITNLKDSNSWVGAVIADDGFLVFYGKIDENNVISNISQVDVTGQILTQLPPTTPNYYLLWRPRIEFTTNNSGIIFFLAASDQSSSPSVAALYGLPFKVDETTLYFDNLLEIKQVNKPCQFTSIFREDSLTTAGSCLIIYDDNAGNVFISEIQLDTNDPITTTVVTTSTLATGKNWESFDVAFYNATRRDFKDSFIFAYRDKADSNKIKAINFTWSLGNYGVPVVIETNSTEGNLSLTHSEEPGYNLAIAYKLTSNEFKAKGLTADLNSVTIAVNNEITLDTGGGTVTLGEINDTLQYQTGKIIVSWTRQTGTLKENQLSFISVSSTGIVSLSQEINLFQNSLDRVLLFSNFSSGSAFAVQMGDYRYNATFYYLTIAQEVKALYGEISKTDGTSYYLTAWTPNEFYLETFLLPSFSSNQTSLIGTITPTSNKVLYVTTDYTNGDVWLFGDFLYNNLPCQIAKSNGVGGFTPIVTSWRRCGGFLVDILGNTYAIRSYNNKNAELYYNNQLRNVTSIPDTTPHNFKWFFDETLYVASSDPNNVMVLKSIPPFTQWSNLTRNHPTNEGITALDKP